MTLKILLTYKIDLSDFFSSSNKVPFVGILAVREMVGGKVSDHIFLVIVLCTLST